MLKLYKVLSPKREAIHGGSYTWPARGVWTPLRRKPLMFLRGWHLVPAHALQQWLMVGAVIWEAEGRGAVDTHPSKSAYASARLVRRVGAVTSENLEAYLDANGDTILTPAWHAYNATAIAAWEGYAIAQFGPGGGGSRAPLPHVSFPPPQESQPEPAIAYNAALAAAWKTYIAAIAVGDAVCVPIIEKAFGRKRKP